MKFLELPKRTSGNRTFGLTSIIDLGVPMGELVHILNDYYSIIDIAKLGCGLRLCNAEPKGKSEFI